MATPNLLESRQEHQGSLMAGQVEGVGLDGPQHLLRQRFIRSRRLMDRVHREGAAVALQHGGLGKALPQVGEIERGGHDHNSQVRCQQGSRFLQQGERQIGISPAFMEFIEEQASHPLQRGVGLESTQKQAISDHLDFGRCRASRFPAHGIADAAPDVVVEGGRQSRGR